MSGRTRYVVPVALRDTSMWPDLDPSCLGESRDNYEARREAILMYLDARSFVAIRARTGKSADEVRRLLKRCIAPAGDGRIFGFRALGQHVRVRSYVRRAPIVHLPGSGSSGCAGALRQLFDRLPEVREYVDDLILKRPIIGEVHEARIRYVDIRAAFIHQLKKAGLTDDDWPFNTRDRGLKSLTGYCKSLSESHLERWVSSRSGIEASRKRGLGQGLRPLILARRPFTFMQLDFHCVDAASIIALVDEYGVEHELLVARWYVGLLVEEFTGAVVGIHLALESTPSADSVLETIESALRPHDVSPGDARLRYTPDGKILINTFQPAYAWHGFTVLQVDNAWSNHAIDVVNNLIEVVGCAINFGPVRAWWIRNLIEHIFGILTARGLKRLPSTYGANSKDTTRTDPAEQASRFRIHLSELFAIIFGCTRDYNLRPTERLMGASPLQVLESAHSSSESDYLPQPLPLDQQKYGRTFWHMAECAIRGNISKHDRPHVRTDRCRYTNSILSNRYNLIGKRLLLYIDRRDVRIAYGSVIETGEMLGAMAPKLAGLGGRARFRNASFSIGQRLLQQVKLTMIQSTSGGGTKDFR
jgi:putative transposase